MGMTVMLTIDNLSDILHNTNVVTSIVKLIVHSRVGYWPISSANKTTEEKEKITVS